VFFDPEASEPLPLNQKQLEDASLKAMLVEGTPSALVLVDAVKRAARLPAPHRSWLSARPPKNWRTGYITLI